MGDLFLCGLNLVGVIPDKSITAALMFSALFCCILWFYILLGGYDDNTP